MTDSTDPADLPLDAEPPKIQEAQVSETSTTSGPTPESEKGDDGEEVIVAFDNLSEEVKTHYTKLAKKLFMFPNSLLRELNELIDSGNVTSAKRLGYVMRDRYKGTLPIPGTTAIRAYIVLRQKQRQVIDRAKTALAEEQDPLSTKVPQVINEKSKSIYQDLTLSVENKKVLLENLIQLCEKRINAIRILQENDPTSSYEQVLAGYIREVRSVTETLIKLRNELKNEGEKEIEMYIGNKLASVLRSTVQAYTSVHGKDKLDLFRVALKLKLKDNKLEELNATNL